MTIQKKIDNFFSKYPERQYKKGETFIQIGDKPKVFYIVSGTVAQYDTSSVGDKLVLNVYKPGSFLPLPSLLNDIPTDFAFEAYDKLTVYVAPRSDTLEFLESSPEIVLDTLKRISQGTNGVLKRLAGVMESSAEYRIIQELEIMHERFDNHNGVAVTEVELAAQTGLARETVNRALKRLREKGTISRGNGRMKINK